MKTEIQNYIDVKNKCERIEKLTNGDWETNYYLKKIVSPLLADIDVDEIIDYIKIKTHVTINSLENEKEIIKKIKRNEE